MKKLYFLLLTLSIYALSFGQDMVITGVFDGPLPGGNPKGIELYVVEDIPDLSLYGMEKAGNADLPTGAQSYTFPADSYTKGDFIYLAIESVWFTQYMGFSPTYTDNIVNHNGDDTLVLYYNGAVADNYGDGPDGTGTAWDSLDGWAYRNSNTAPNSTFTVSEWSFSGPDALDGCDNATDDGTNATCASTIPVGSFTTTLSTNDFNTKSFNVYPNPTNKGSVNIVSSNTSNYGKINVAVYDVLGKQIINKVMTSEKLNVSTLNTGVYIMKITQGKAISTKKLVIN
jgi:hypothetical protein